MTPHEKALSSINTRLERLQANLREATGENAQRFLFQSLVVTVALAESLNDYVRGVGDFAQRRHGEVRRTNEVLEARHADALKSGQELLEKLKANPTDQAVRKEIEAVQRAMAEVQKSVRRGANALQRELAPSLAMIDEMSVSVRRFSEADQGEALKRLVKTVVSQAREFYSAHPVPPAKHVIEAEAWETSALSEIEQATDFYDAYARAGYQAALALELMTMALSEDMPRTAADATERANAAVAARLKAVAARLTAT